MKVSVVTVAYNSEATIGHTVRSFLAQSWRDAELLVIDGASTDGTVEVVRAFDDPRIRLVSEPDRGLYDAMNKGLRLFSGDAVGFLNSDDRFHDAESLAAIAGGLGDHDVVFGNLDFVDDHESARVVRRWRGSPWRPGAFRAGWMPAHPTFYIRRAVAERTGEFCTDYRISADYDFMLRAMETAPCRAAFLDRVLVDMMYGGSSTAGWRAYLRGNLESLAARRRWLGAGPVDRAFFAKPLSKVGQWLHRA